MAYNRSVIKYHSKLGYWSGFDKSKWLRYTYLPRLYMQALGSVHADDVSSVKKIWTWVIHWCQIY